MEKIWIKKELYILNYEFMKFYAFFRFLFDFLFYFFTKIAKRGFITCRCWRGERELRRADTWCAGPPHGCDVALRPRGRAVGGPRGAQEAHRARTRGRRGGWQMEGPRVSGPWLVIWGGNAFALPPPPPPLFNRKNAFFLFRVGLYSHGILLLQVTWTFGRRRILSKWRRSRGPESTRS